MKHLLVTVVLACAGVWFGYFIGVNQPPIMRITQPLPPLNWSGEYSNPKLVSDGWLEWAATTTQLGHAQSSFQDSKTWQVCPGDDLCPDDPHTCDDGKLGRHANGVICVPFQHMQR